MEQTTIHGEIMILSGREAIVIPCLSVVGAASIVGAVGYGVYKLGKKVVTKVTEKHDEKES